MPAAVSANDSKGLYKVPQDTDSESSSPTNSPNNVKKPLEMDIGQVSDEPLGDFENGDDQVHVVEEGTTTGTRRHDLFKTIAGVAGNVLEWYDFAVFGFFGDIISEVFFPKQAGNAALVESFAIFGGAFLMRPIGGMMFGFIGDRYGRKRALELSVFLMAGPTFCMGCLPSYNQVGWVSPVLLTIVRLLQGLSVGGQLMSSLVFTLEGHPRSKWGLYGSFVLASANFGTLLGGIIGFFLRTFLNDGQLSTWGWRVPFLSGILVSLSGIYLKFYCDEGDEIHVHSNAAGPSNPIREAFAKENRRSLLAASLVPMLWSAGFYLTFVWMAIFMNDLVEPAVPGAFAVNSTSLFVSVCCLFPLAGILSDKYGRKRVMTIGGVSMGLLSPFMVIIIGAGNPYAAFFAQSTLGIALSFWGAPMCAWLVEAFPPSARLTSVAIGYNLAQATIGGLTPSLATVMVDTLGTRSPGLLLTILAVSSLIGLLCVAPPPPPLVSDDLTNGTTMNGDGYALPGEESAVDSASGAAAEENEEETDEEVLEGREIT